MLIELFIGSIHSVIKVDIASRYLKFVGKSSRVIVIKTFPHTPAKAKNIDDNANTVSEF